MSELALQLIREAKEKRLTRLDLGNCGLTELPEELFELVWLEELVLSNEGTQNNIGEGNNIGVLSSSFKKLKLLKVLDLEGNGGKEKFNLKNISTLADLKNLTSLNLSFTQVADLNPLKGLSKLQILNVSEAQVSDLRPVANLIHLQTLRIPSTQVSDLDPVKNLIQLRTLNISGTLISSLLPIIKLSQLQFLDASLTKVKDLSPLSNIKQLQYLDLSFTQVSDLGPISTLMQLQSLRFPSTKVKDLEPISALFQLQSLAIPSILVQNLNPLKNIIEKGDLIRIGKSVSGIMIEGHKLPNPPNEIVKQGSEAILNYWKQIEEQGGKVELYEAKLIIVGEGGTGKTTLFEKLKDASHKVGSTSETHGINIHEGLPFTHPLVGENIFHANLWDFGGQELQYMTHQFFLTPRALYVLMMDARRESPNLAYWFKIISLLGRDKEDSTEKVQLLLVFNKRGTTTGQPPQFQDKLQYYEDRLDIQFMEVDFAENDFRFDNLRSTIQKSLVTLPIVKSQLPRMWKAVREDLRKVAKTNQYITTQQLSVICSKYGITEEEDQWLLSSYLHQLGSLLHFQNDKGLRQLVILSPQWAADGVYTFLSEEIIVNQKGRFREALFLKLLFAKKYTRESADVILQLMTKNNFDICYEATEGNYVATQLLPDNAPEYQWFPHEVLQFRYQYPIMPKGLISRLIVRLSDDIEFNSETGEQVVWQKGVVLYMKLREGECRVRLLEDDAEFKAGLRQIFIDVMGDRDARKYALRRVRDTVDDLHQKWFRSIKADEMVPCCCTECVVDHAPQLYKLENLLKLKEKRPNAVCYSSGEDVPVQRLLEGVYDQKEINTFVDVHRDNYHQHGG